MEKIPFSREEMKVVGSHIGFSSVETAPQPMYNTPISPKENFKRALSRDGSALWFPTTTDSLYVESRTNIDHIARAEIRDMGPVQPLNEKGGKDLFGVTWKFIEVAGGSMVEPGNPMLEDVNDWKDVIQFPDVNALDWEGCKINAPLNQSTRLLGATFQNGMFERLISFMEFENAAVALIDEEQQDAVHELFGKLCDMYEAMIDKYLEILKLDAITFHDDWGAQRSPFFSLDVCEEMVAPYIKRLADYCHAKGMYFNQHSCGKNEMLVPAMVKAGVDIWMPQPMNDVDMLIEKYGEHIAFGVTPPALPEDASDEEVEAAAKAFAEKYAPNFYQKPIVVSTMRTPQRMIDAIYRQSRIALCGQAE